MTGRPIDNVSNLPESIQRRFRGRSVPSPGERVDKQTIVHYIERHIVPVRVDTTGLPPNEILLFLASSDLFLDKIVVKLLYETNKSPDIKLEAIAFDGSSRAKILAPTEGASIKFYTNIGWKTIDFAVLHGEELWLKAPQDTRALVTLEFIRDGGVVSKSE